MERQRSFSLKPTRLMVFTFTIFSSFLFCLFFSYVFTYPTSATLSNHVNFTPKASAPQNFTSVLSRIPVRERGNTILEDTHLNESANFERGEESDVPSDGMRSLESRKPISNYTSLRKFIKSYGKPGDSFHQKLASKGNRSDVLTEEKASFEAKNSKVASATSRKPASVSLRSKAPVVNRSLCDFSTGSWVFDEMYPLYSNRSCPFIDEGFDCQANGRLDRDYMKWRWQPRDCNIPRFNPARMLELLRGKRLVFVGDSINRNQWESMLCLLRGAAKDPNRVYEAHGRKITKEKGNYNFKFVEYRLSVEYYVTHFLVHESKARVGKKRVKTLRVDSIDRGSSRWKGADILVFNSAHWWSHYKTKAGVNYYQEGDLVHHHLNVSTAFRKALTTWASWVDQHINPSRTKVFFRSSAPSHFSGGQWNSGGHCKEATQPLNDTSNRYYHDKNIIAEEVIQLMKTPVTLLNVTGLSEFRIDGHPSVYGKKQSNGPSSRIEDCSHWCLPGVPDTWNELLYYHLQSQQKTLSTG